MNAVSIDPLPVEPPELLSRARAGDTNAFAGLVRQHQGSVYSIGLRMLNHRAQAEDLAQDVFLQLYRKLDSIESMEHLGYWLRRVAANLAIDWLRRLPYSATQPLDEGAQVASHDTLDDPLMSRELARLLGELAPPARAVIGGQQMVRWDLAKGKVTADFPIPMTINPVPELAPRRDRVCGPNHVLLDGRILVDLDKRSHIWSYFGPNVSTGGPDGRHWYVAGRDDTRTRPSRRWRFPRRTSIAWWRWSATRRSSRRSAWA